MKFKVKATLVIQSLALAVLLICLSGCTPQEKAEATALVQSALSNLVQNRQLVEQFGRDVKANVEPSDPAYSQALESYMLAREAYNRFLDGVEGGDGLTHTRSLVGHSPLEAQNAAAAFLEDATRALKPSLNSRRIPFQRAVLIPDDLSGSLNRLPKRARQRIIENLDPQVRWSTWGDL